jgi:hypothetical protein
MRRGQIICERPRLLMSARRQLHVNPPTEDAMVAGFDLAVAEEEETGGSGGIHFTAISCKASNSRMPTRPSVSIAAS